MDVNGVERGQLLGLEGKDNVERNGVFEKEGEGLVTESSESLNTDGEVFEEAIDSQEVLEELEAKSDLKVDDGAVGDLGSGVVGDGGENFQEASDVPAEVGQPEELAAADGNEEVEKLLGVESVDKIDEGGTEKETMNELNGRDAISQVEVSGGAEVLGSVDTSSDVELSREIVTDNCEEQNQNELVAETDELVDAPDVFQEHEGIKGNGRVEVERYKNGHGELEDNLTGCNSVHEIKNDECLKNNQETFSVEHSQDGNGDLKDTSVLMNTEHQDEISELKISTDVQKTSEDKAEERPKTTSSPEDVFDKKNEESQSTKAKLNSDNGLKCQHSKDEKIVNIGMTDGQTVEAELGKDDEEKESIKKNNEVEIKPASSTSEKLMMVKDQEEKQSIQENKDVEIKPAMKIASTSEKPTTVKNQDERQSIQENKEVESTPTAKTTSSSVKPASPAPLPSHPAGLGRAAPLPEPASRVVQHPRANEAASQPPQQIEEHSAGEGEEYDETREKLQMIRVKFLRLSQRLGQNPHNVVVAQVLYRLGLAEQLRGRNGGRVGAFSFDRASAMAEQLEAAGQEPLDFSCTIMVLGKTGVGKSATINSIFDEAKFNTDAFQLGTKKVQDIVGTVQGIKVRVIDTPGLLPSWSDQQKNERILHSIKNFIKKTPPDIVLYLDRLDMQSRDSGDMPLLRTITEIFGPSIWFNAIVVLTHAASAPPEGPNGTVPSYDMFVTQRSTVVQQAIRQAAGDMRLMNPVSLVENHSACRTNRAGQRVLPNGQVWKPHLLLLSFASKILAEANALLKLQDSPTGKTFLARSRAPPLPFLLSSLLQSRAQVKLPEEQFGDDDGLDDGIGESSDSEDEAEYEELPPFQSLTKAQLAKLTKAERKAYFDELEYREKLLMKKQLKKERARRKMMKKMAAEAKDLPNDYSENVEEEPSGAASVPVPMPDLALPASFDSDNPTHRYRCLDSSNQWLVRPVLDTHGWDHDVGYEGINVERLFVVKDRIPISFSSQITKDKKDANVQMEVMSSVKHGEGKATSLGFDMQSVGKDLAYTLRSETSIIDFRKNKATAGLSITHLGDALSAGLKVEDKLVIGKRFQMVLSGGAMSSRGDVAYGGSLEAQLRDPDYPLGHSLSTLGLSIMDWHGDVALGCNLQSQVPLGRNTNLVARANINNRGAGQISIRLNSTDQLQIAFVALIPMLKKLFGHPQQT